jgi:pyridoxal phosphate enzyme (YggS family)
MNIRRNLEAVREKIAAAARRSGRAPESVELVCVTKSVGPIEIREAVGCGVTRIGENRVQEAGRKKQAVSGLSVDWDLIGHLQTNKINAALEIFGFIHSVDSLKLAEEIGERAARRGIAIPVLLEVNVFGEENKFGFRPSDLEAEIGAIGAVRGIEVQGLMTMAPWYDDPELTRPGFAALRELGEKLRDRGVPGFHFRHLSMGMTNDYEVAVEEGATLVRIGSAIFRNE